MRLALLLAPLFLLSACGNHIGISDSSISDTGGGDTGTAADTGTTDTATHDTATHDTGTHDTGSNACTASVVSTSPADAETDVAVTKIPTIRFSAAVGPNDWSLSVDGVQGTATLASDSLSATFQPDADFATQTQYTLNASACGAPATANFTTAGDPLPASDMEGNTYALDYNNVTWAEPAGLGQLLSSFVNIQYFLVNIISVDTTAQTIHAALSLGITDSQSNIVQDPCTAPLDYGDQDFSGNPVFDLGPQDLSLSGFALSSAEFKAAFADSGNSIQGIRISGQIDTSSWGLNVCGFLQCTPCLSSPTQSTCLDVLLTADQADKVDGLVFDPALDPTQNPSCP